MLFYPSSLHVVQCTDGATVFRQQWRLLIKQSYSVGVLSLVVIVISGLAMIAEYRFDESYGAAIKFGDGGGGTYCSGGVAGFLDWDYQYAVVDDDFYCDGDL
ncbi:MAG: hypothetical protein CMIDDMOC_00912 [Sodalis sp. Fle]|nr:MAG: hypothetical protein CMIDDMOC_00912 [Sodalis sp. Fle]